MSDEQELTPAAKSFVGAVGRGLEAMAAAFEPRKLVREAFEEYSRRMAEINDHAGQGVSGTATPPRSRNSA